MHIPKPRLSFMQIINMNVGFFGIQYSFGLQQSAVNPIYDFLGAKPDEIPGPCSGTTGIWKTNDDHRRGPSRIRRNGARRCEAAGGDDVAVR